MSTQPPNDQQIHQTLMRLHDELERAQSLDDDERAMMHHLMADIQEMLKRAERKPSPRYQPNQSFLDRLQEAIDKLEVTHPDLTLAIEKALDTLSIAGI